MTKNTILFIIGVAVVAAVIIFVTLHGTPPVGPLLEEGVPSASGGPLGAAPSPTPTPSLAPRLGLPNITVVAPIADEKLVIGQVYNIKWSSEGGTKGFIYLADPATKEVVGWINSETGPHDTSYDWDARDIYLARYSPAKKPLEVGRYIIGVGFENRRLPATSAAFDVIYPSQLSIQNYNVAINGYVMSPDSLTVKKGSKIIFANQDSVSHKVVYGSSYFVVAPGASYTFDTTVLFPGPYNFYSEQYSATARISVTVQ
ncbi:MAG: hypothetical protein AAB897_01980 [Patescibacteria group bacterium]